MNGYSPKLPLLLSPAGGFRLNRTLLEVVKQNLKMLVLTSPGERIMEPTFGVGIYNFLFELNTEVTKERIRSDLAIQVQRYMPFIKLNDVMFSTNPDVVDFNSLAMAIMYTVPSLGVADALELILKN